MRRGYASTRRRTEVSAPMGAEVVEHSEDMTRRVLSLSTSMTRPTPPNGLMPVLGSGLATREEPGRMDIPGGEIPKFPAGPAFVLGEHQMARNRGDRPLATDLSVGAHLLVGADEDRDPVEPAALVFAGAVVEGTHSRGKRRQHRRSREDLPQIA